MKNIPILTALQHAPLTALCAATPWWENYPLIIQNADAASILALTGDVGFRADHADPSWGIYVQKSISKGDSFRWAGPLNYFDTEAFCGTYTLLHPTFGGGRAMTYPGGKSAHRHLNETDRQQRQRHGESLQGQ